PADVRQVSYAAGLCLCHFASVYKLREKPETNQECSWNEGDSHKNEDKQERFNLVSRIGHHKRAHHRCYGSARAEVWNCRVGVGQNLGQHGHYAAEQVEDQISASTHDIFDLRSEGPKKNHVADDVRPTAMHEHGRQDGDPAMTGNDLLWNCCPPKH